MAPAPNPGPIHEGYLRGSIGWTEQRKQDESFIAGFLFGGFLTMIVMKLLGGI